MVSVIQRGRKLQALLAVRLGPGAAVLSPEVTRIHLDFVKGATVAKKFWRRCLPRLKYHNPAIPMTVTQSTAPDGPSTLTIHFADPSAPSSKPLVNSTADAQISSAPTSPTKSGPTTVRTKVIQMHNQTTSEILTKLMELTKGKPVKPTADEARQLREIEEFTDQSNADRERMKAVTEALKREEAILTQARGEVEAMKDK